MGRRRPDGRRRHRARADRCRVCSGSRCCSRARWAYPMAPPSARRRPSSGFAELQTPGYLAGSDGDQLHPDDEPHRTGEHRPVLRPHRADHHDIERLHLGQPGHRLRLRSDPRGQGRRHDRGRRRRTRRDHGRCVRHLVRDLDTERPSGDDAASLRPRPRRAGYRRRGGDADPGGARARTGARARIYGRDRRVRHQLRRQPCDAAAHGDDGDRDALALDDAGLAADAVGFVNGHGTATEWGDIAESQATQAVFGAASRSIH